MASFSSQWDQRGSGPLTRANHVWSWSPVATWPTGRTPCRRSTTLPSCIFTRSQYYAERFSSEADVGMVGVNVGICAPHPYIPFGGIKGSLLGTNKVQGKDSIDFFTQNKVVTIRTAPKDGQAPAAVQGGRVRSCVAS